MNNSTVQNAWDSDSIYAKALLYIEQMESCSPEEWQYGLWSALSLELLSRAALANISPVLLADYSSKDLSWMNLMYALQKEITAKKFTPKSVSITEVFKRLQTLISPSFTSEDLSFCIKHIEYRNAELHAGEAVFVDYKPSEWLPKFYKVSKILLESMGKSLDDFVSDSKTALKLLDSLDDAIKKAVDDNIKAHATVWSNKNKTEQEGCFSQATLWATKQSGHRVKCPSCDSPALLYGESFGAVKTEIEDDKIIQKQTMLPSKFECIACGLKILGFSKLSSCELGEAFSETDTYSAAEFFELYTKEELNDARREADDFFEPDFNE